MNQAITGYHKDDENHWVADLECGHAQHVRHDPPWMERLWVTTDEGRQSHLGKPLNCVRCDEMAQKIAKELISECKKSLKENYEDAGISGLCADGRWDVALDSLNKLDINKIAERALKKD